MIMFILQLAGAAALLIWSVQNIRTGVERAFLPQLRQALRHSERSRVLTAFSGMIAAMFLQSSTAVALIASGFAVSTGLAASSGLAILLGADLGSALATQVLLARIEGMEPLLFLMGTILYLRSNKTEFKQTGRILIGLGLVFMSLGMIREATEVLKDNPAVSTLAGFIQGDAASAFILGTVLAYAVHSSLAAVLIFVTFVATGVLSTQTGIAMVLGANLGGALIPVILTLSQPSEARHAIIGNLILRGGCATAALMATTVYSPDFTLLGAESFRQVINFHLAFNLCLLLIALPIVGWTALLVTKAMPKSSPILHQTVATSFDPGLLNNPDRALAAVGREALRMTERVTEMLAPALRLYKNWDDHAAKFIERSDDDVDQINFSAKLFLARLQEGSLTPAQSKRSMALATIVNNIEDAGDRISTDLVGLARHMKDKHISFSEEGLQDLADFHDVVLANAHLSLDVLMADDAEVARQLLARKDYARKIEQKMQERHLERLRKGSAETLNTSNMHQDTIRALNHINTSLCYIAYPIVEKAGVLLPTRLTQPDGQNLVHGSTIGNKESTATNP